MNKPTSVILVLALVAILGMTLQIKALDLGAETMTLIGDIIDNLCATGNKDHLADFVKTHTKQCALMPNCAASGYSIYADGQLYKFDQTSDQKVEEFLKKENSKLQVVVTAKKVGEELNLISIENQK